MNSNKLKLAVCFFGRTYGHQTMYSSKAVNKKVRFLFGLQSIRENVFQNHDVDVYCHAWVDCQSTKEKIIKLLNPKDIIVEKQKEFYKDVIPQAFMSQFFSRSKSIDLALSSNKEYDLIVAIRYDVFFFNPVNYHVVEKNKLYIDGDSGTRDWHFVGDCTTMKKIVDMLEYASFHIERKTHLPSQGVIYFPYYKSLNLETENLLNYNPQIIDKYNTDICLVRSLDNQKIIELEKEVNMLG